jgi:methionyl-tRNA formyltransferase
MDRWVNDRPLRVVLMRGDDYHNLYLDRVLESEFEIALTVIEPGKSQRRALYRRGKFRDAVAAEYHRFRRRALGLTAYRRRFFGDIQWTRSSIAHEVVITDSINSAETTDALRRASADICVISCTTRLSADTIAAVGCPILNIHGGHLPDYRGCHCFFFALYEGNFHKIGSTIHFVNAGLDTGDIVEVVRPAISPADNAERLYCKAEMKAAHRMASLLSDYVAGGDILARPQEFRGRLILRRNRLPHHDILFALRRRLRVDLIPTVADGEVWDSGSPRVNHS